MSLHPTGQLDEHVVGAEPVHGEPGDGSLAAEGAADDAGGCDVGHAPFIGRSGSVVGSQVGWLRDD